MGDITTTTEVPTTTAEPLPYELNFMTVTKDVVYLTRPRQKTEGAFPFIVPLIDEYNITQTSNVNAVIGFNEKLHIATWDLTESIHNITTTEWYRNSEEGRMRLKNFHIPSPVWPDPNGRMVIGSHDIRPFQTAGTQNSQFFIFYNSFDAEEGFRELSEFSHLPYGMAWSLDNRTLYYSDGFSKSLVKCSYNLKRAEVSGCEELLDISQEYEKAVPRGMATDMNDHIWLALADNEEKGAVIEVDPETRTIISTIEVEDKDLVDLKFGGSNLDFLYLLSEKHLYKVSGMGVTGKEVSDFQWRPDI